MSTEYTKKKYTKEELKAFDNAPGDTDVDLDRLTFWTMVKWMLFGPPGNTGPR